MCFDRLIAAVLVVLTACAPDPWGLDVGHFDVALMGDATPAQRVILEAAIYRWNVAAEGELFTFVGEADAVRGGRVTVMFAPVSGLDGEASFWTSGGHVIAVEIVVDEALSGKRLANTIAHELGHAIGLGHDESEGSVMHESEDGEISAEDAAYARAVLLGESVSPEYGW